MKVEVDLPVRVDVSVRVVGVGKVVLKLDGMLKLNF